MRNEIKQYYNKEITKISPPPFKHKIKRKNNYLDNILLLACSFMTVFLFTYEKYTKSSNIIEYENIEQFSLQIKKDLSIGLNSSPFTLKKRSQYDEN